MDSARVGALFFHAVEDLVRANDIVLTLQLREAVDAGALREAYGRQVRSRPTLRSALQLEPVPAGHGWEPLDDRQLEPLLEQQLAAMVMASAEPEPEPDLEPAVVFHPTNSVLPYRVRLVHPRRLEVRVSHLLTNGQGALFWADDLLALLGGELVDLPLAPRVPAVWRRRASVLRETLWSLAWIASFLVRTGRSAAAHTVDLSDGRAGLPMGQGFVRMGKVLSEEDSRSLVSHARRQGRRVNSLLLSTLAAELLGARPDKDQVGIVMPDDLLASRPGVPRCDPGNHTGALVARLKRAAGDAAAAAAETDDDAIAAAANAAANTAASAADLSTQADAALRWARRGVVAGTTRLADLPLRDERQLREQMRTAAAKPLTARGPFESNSCVLSNVGARREFTRLSEGCEWVSITSFGQLPILSALDVSGRVAFEFSASRDLFDCDEMQHLFDGFVSRLLSSVRHP